MKLSSYQAILSTQFSHIYCIIPIFFESCSNLENPANIKNVDHYKSFSFLNFSILFQFLKACYKIKYWVKFYSEIVSLLCYFRISHSILIENIMWNHNTIYFKQMCLKIDRESKPLLYPIVNLSNFKKEIIHSGTLTPWCNLPFVEGELHNLTIFNILRWLIGSLGQTTQQPSIWCSKYYNFFTISCKILCKNCFNLFLY